MRILIPIPPRTKKNSQRIIMTRGKYGKMRPMILPSDAYRQYEKDCGFFLKAVEPFLGPCNVKCEYFMPTRRKVDLVNLQEATLDILVHYGILMDDNSNVVISMDGSRVFYDKEYPRTEIEITEANINEES